MDVSHSRAICAAVIAVLVLTAIAAVLISPAVPSDPTLLPASTLLLVGMMAIASLFVGEERRVLTSLSNMQPAVLQLRLQALTMDSPLRC